MFGIGQAVPGGTPGVCVNDLYLGPPQVSDPLLFRLGQFQIVFAFDDVDSKTDASLGVHAGRGQLSGQRVQRPYLHYLLLGTGLSISHNNGHRLTPVDIR